MRHPRSTPVSLLPLITLGAIVAGCTTPHVVDGPDASADTATSDGGRDVGDIDAPSTEDAGTTDAGADGGVRTNPAVTLIREITFEQPDGTDGWSDPASVIFDWQDHPTGRDRVPGAFVRVAGGINVPALSDTLAYRGARSARLTMQPWSSPDTFRTDMEMIGDVTASPPIGRTFPQGTTVLVGFAMRIEHTTMLGGGFQLMHQYHNNNPARAGYGTTNNPALSLLRSNDTDMSVALRDNRPGGERLNTFESIPGGVRAGQWVRWVFKTRFANFDSGENGLVEVYSAVGDEPLTMHFRVDDRPLGYAYENPAHTYELIMFDMYGSPRQDDAVVYFDEIRIAEGDLDPSVVDPIHWVSYQHVLNAPYDADLLEPTR